MKKNKIKRNRLVLFVFLLELYFCAQVTSPCHVKNLYLTVYYLKCQSKVRYDNNRHQYYSNMSFTPNLSCPGGNLQSPGGY